MNTRRELINIFVRAIYLYDDRMTLILNSGGRPITLDDILLNEIDGQLVGSVSESFGCSSLVAVAPPKFGKHRVLQCFPNFFHYAVWCTPYACIRFTLHWS